MRAVEWQNSFIGELDITSTELNEETLRDVLLRMPGFTYLAVGYCEFFSDQVSDVLLRMPGFTYLAVGYCEFFSDQVRASCTG